MSWIWTLEYCNFNGPIMRPSTSLGQCWEWKGKKTRPGYGFTRSKGRVFYAHRMAWEFENGKPVPPGKMVLHHCDNPACIRPEHLYIGTHADNMRDAKERGRIGGRAKTHCKRGHPLEGDNLVLKSPKGRSIERVCRECRRQAAARYRKERRNG